MITKAALVCVRASDNTTELLLVRERNRPYLIFPGGKQDEGETVEEALHRELLEELDVQAAEVSLLGQVAGHTPDGRPLVIHLFIGTLTAEPRPQAEITELVWMSRSSVEADASIVTPIMRDEVMPFLAEKGVW